MRSKAVGQASFVPTVSRRDPTDPGAGGGHTEPWTLETLKDQRPG